MIRPLIKFVNGFFLKPFEREAPPSKKVAILIPMSTRTELTEEEEISMRQLEHYLGGYDRFLLVREGMSFDFDGYRNKAYPQRFFGSGAAHGKLLGTLKFYRDWLDYDYIFFYHLDALVFSDQLEDWCDKGLDYIGPPWIKSPDSPWVTRPRVGNGGFTLLRVESALKALTNRYLEKPTAFWYDWFTADAPRWLVNLVASLERAMPENRALKRLMCEWHEMANPAKNNRNNDVFWSDQAVRYYPEFKVASLEQGLSFAFEVSPTTCLEMNGGKMPFGCHAWGKYDRDFWLPHLVSDGGDAVEEERVEACA